MLRLAFLLALPLLLASASTQTTFEGPILAVHQAERAAVGVPGLVWNRRLAADADKWARYLARTGQLAHYADITGDWNGPGENLWMGTHGEWSPSDMVREWAGEKRNFRPGVFPSVQRRGYAEVGHYTQMVWRRTRSIGCGMASDGDWDYLVCRYDTPGNVMGERVF